MANSKHLETIYKIIEKKFDPSKAREHISTMIHNLIFNLQESGEEITEEKIEAALKREAELFEACVKKDVA